MPQSSQSPRESPARRERRRRTHQRIDSNGERLTSRHDRNYDDDDEIHGTSSKSRPRKPRRESRHARHTDSENSRTTATPLSSEQLAQLEEMNRKLGWGDYDNPHRTRQKRDYDDRTRADGGVYRDRREEERELERERRRQERRRKRREERRAAERAEGGGAYESLSYTNSKWKRRERDRIPSGQMLERGASRTYRSEKERYRDEIHARDGGSSSDPDFDDADAERKRKRRRNIFIGVGVLLVLLAIFIPVGVVVSRRDDNGSSGGGGSPGARGSAAPSNANLNGMSQDDIPQEYRQTYLDPFTWYDTGDFNVTFTSNMVGGLSIMGLNDTWDDDTRANDNVKPLTEVWSYGTDQIRGVNLGGWLSIEPFITPSFFSSYSGHDNVVDEFPLTQKLGPSKALSMLEKHYSSFVSEQTFKDIQDAGFDHVRIPYGYWAVTTYDGDPYVPRASWRYLLRGIEWARKYGLRVNLDLHGAPGSQNGWNHSGRQGSIGWLNGTDGDLNGQRTIDIHKQLSAFFTQPRYTNLVTMYGLVNEPRMVELDTQQVLDWTTKAVQAVQGNNFTGIIVFGDGFMGLDNWQGKLQGMKNLLLDVHQYVIFNVDQIVLNHHDKVNFACGGWTAQAQRSQNTATGFGPTLCGEWSQADTDCAQYLNNVGVGSRWEGTLNMVSGMGGSKGGSVLSPTCPTKNSPRCSCDEANADPGSYSDEYKQFLRMFAEAQMHSFEEGWGWFYWTWQTESAAQWSYKAGMKAGTLPQKAYQRDFNCSSDIPDFSGLGLPEYF